MNSKVLMLSAIGWCAGLTAGCGSSGDYAGGSSSPPPPPTPPASLSLDTAQVLALARQTSEVSTPFVVNGGAVKLTDTSDTAESMSVNMMM